MPNKLRARSTLVYKAPNALRHGVYSRTSVLPGEDQAAFDELHRGLIAEFSPDGVFECDIIQTWAGLLWRKQNLETLRMATLAQGRLSKILDDMVAAKFPGHAEIITHPESKEMIELAKVKVCEELGDVYALLELGEAASFDSFSKILGLIDRIDGMIDKCVKRFLFVRGVKSMAGAANSASIKLVAGPPAGHEPEGGCYPDIDSSGRGHASP